jgi:uncharacterized protein (DUF697 family)
MKKKKLPKAIQQLPEHVYEPAVASRVSEPPASSAATAHALREEQPGPAGPDTVVRSAESTSVAAEILPPPRAPVPLGINLQNRRRVAQGIVERYANYSALGGVIPLPVLNAGAVTAIILRMVKALSGVYHVPFEQDRTRAIVLGLIGGLTPTATSTMTASALLFLMPGSNLVGLAVSSLTASACTRRIGSIFVEHFESGASVIDFPLSRAANRLLGYPEQ